MQSITCFCSRHHSGKRLHCLVADVLRRCTWGVAYTDLESFQNFLKGGALLCVSVPALNHQLLEVFRHMLGNCRPATHQHLEEDLWSARLSLPTASLSPAERSTVQHVSALGAAVQHMLRLRLMAGKLPWLTQSLRLCGQSSHPSEGCHESCVSMYAFCMPL